MTVRAGGIEGTCAVQLHAHVYGWDGCVYRARSALGIAPGGRADGRDRPLALVRMRSHAALRVLRARIDVPFVYSSSGMHGVTDACAYACVCAWRIRVLACMRPAGALDLLFVPRARSTHHIGRLHDDEWRGRRRMPRATASRTRHDRASDTDLGTPRQSEKTRGGTGRHGALQAASMPFANNVPRAAV